MRSERLPRRGLDAAWWASLAIALVYALLCASGALRTGTSWDEIEHRIYGEMSIGFYRSFGADRAATTYWTNYYGALHALVAAVAERLLPALHWSSARHLAAVAFSLVGFVHCVRLARLLAGPWAGGAAAFLLATTPRWTGDAMFNPVDVPAGAMYVTALYYLARIAGAPARATRRDWLLFGITAGLTLAVRAIGVLLLPYAALVVAAWAASAPRPRRVTLRAEVPRMVERLALATVAAVAVTFALWPRMLVEPYTTLADTLWRTGAYPWPGDILFRGEYHPGRAAPSSYLPVWFGITTPLATFAGLGLAAVFRRAWLPAERGPLLRAGLVAFALLFPPVYATATGATLYDGIRHFLFVLPPLTALAAAGWGAALGALAARGRAVLAGATAVLVLLAAEPIAWYARSHPFEYVYFNPLAGGLARASHAYDTDYWGLTLRSAAEALEAHRRELVGPDGTLACFTNAPWHLIEPWLDDPTKHRKAAQDEPHQVVLMWSRRMPVGWHLEPPAARSARVVADQVPFWQTYLVPRAAAGR